MKLDKRIDFAFIISANKCNPNGDPLDGNAPRQNFEGYGIMSDVCLKRKIRDRLSEMGYPIIMQPPGRSTDGCYGIADRIKADDTLKKLLKAKDSIAFSRAACKKWIDVRCFGQVFAFKEAGTGNVSIGIRGPVSIQHAVSINPIDVLPMEITKIVTGGYANREDPMAKSSDSMGIRYIINRGIYVSYGSIYPYLADRTGFTMDDANLIKNAIWTMFDNDASVARPAGSMNVEQLYWWTHKCKTGACSVARVHRSLNVESSNTFPFFTANAQPIDGVELEIIQ